MRWKGGRRSGNIEDRRGRGMGMVGGGVGGLVVVIAALLLGVDPGALLQGGGAGPAPGADAPGSTAAPEDELGAFADVVLAQTEDAWNPAFRASGAEYQEPTLVLFEGYVGSACGTASSAVGPFYCPIDGKLYLDLEFFEQLRALGAPGDFARGYVIAHEVGHHVQNLTGAMDRVTPGESGPSSGAVRLELQADCYAGVWGYHARQQGVLDPGDLEEALAAAAAIGDDTLQRRGQGHVAPESFTHGTAEQRARWFRTGFESGDRATCDTFSGSV
jgi:predicted metalloprotease